MATINAHPTNTQEEKFEQSLVDKIAEQAITEQRRARRWGVFFKLVFIVYLVLLTVLFYVGGDGGYKYEIPINVGGKHTALVDLSGVISADFQTADRVVEDLRAAFEHRNTAGIILRINSPGGSPVQAGYINDEIRRLREEYPDTPLYAVIVDVCASGGYYIAAAAEKIYADKASIIGSIGVIFSGFGFVESLEKLGIERRVLYAGKSKNFLDPFLPLKQEDVKHFEHLLTEVHQQFIDIVKQGRGDKLAADEQIFSGLVWTGEQSIKLGLVDALGSAGYVAREVIRAENIVDFTRRETLFDQFAEGLGAILTRALRSVLTDFEVQ